MPPGAVMPPAVQMGTYAPGAAVAPPTGAPNYGAQAQMPAPVGYPGQPAGYPPSGGESTISLS